MNEKFEPEKTLFLVKNIDIIKTKFDYLVFTLNLSDSDYFKKLYCNERYRFEII